jgi:hypothetical protein
VIRTKQLFTNVRPAIRFFKDGMNTKNLEINIPAAIAELPLTIGEKVVLAHIHRFPGCSNARLAELIGGTCRGVESLLRRLRQQHYIEQTRKGRARRHHLLFPVERHTLCGDGDAASSDVKSHTSCGDEPDDGLGVQSPGDALVLRRGLSWEEELDQSLAIIQELCELPDPFPVSIVNFYGRALKRVVEEAPECPAKEALVRELTTRRDAFVAFSFGARLPRNYHRQIAQLIRAATPEKLAQFRQRVEAGELDQNAPLMLTALADDGEVLTI